MDRDPSSLLGAFMCLGFLEQVFLVVFGNEGGGMYLSCWFP